MNKIKKTFTSEQSPMYIYEKRGLIQVPPIKNCNRKLHYVSLATTNHVNGLTDWKN